MISFCKGIFKDAICCRGHVDGCVGFVFGGDADVGLAPWATAFAEEGGWQLTFEEPQFLYGVARKGGDLIVAAARRGANMRAYENNCRVAGRERQHDCMFFEWSCTGSLPPAAQPAPLPARAKQLPQPAPTTPRRARPRCEPCGCFRARWRCYRSTALGAQRCFRARWRCYRSRTSPGAGARRCVVAQPRRRRCARACPGAGARRCVVAQLPRLG